MYCIECGIKTTKNSKYCFHCGKLQNRVGFSENNISKELTETDKVRKTSNTQEQRLAAYRYLRKAIGWYLAWIIIHLGILLIASDGIFNVENMGGDLFWPFGINPSLNIGDYDITEFLVYTIFPISIILIGGLISSQWENSKRK